MTVPEPRLPVEEETGPPGPRPGLDDAIKHSDSWWSSSARRALDDLAATGREFTAWDLTEHYGIAEPHHPGQWGALFRVAAMDGVIEPVGATISRRPTRAGSLCRVWRGTRRVVDIREGAT